MAWWTSTRPCPLNCVLEWRLESTRNKKYSASLPPSLPVGCPWFWARMLTWNSLSSLHYVKSINNGVKSKLLLPPLKFGIQAMSSWAWLNCFIDFNHWIINHRQLHVMYHRICFCSWTKSTVLCTHQAWQTQWTLGVAPRRLMLSLAVRVPQLSPISCEYRCYKPL